MVNCYNFRLESYKSDYNHSINEYEKYFDKDLIQQLKMLRMLILD